MASRSISATSGTVTTKLVVSEKYQSIAYSEGRMLKLEQNSKAAFEACGFKIDEYR